jgi:hypothetical protein
MTKLPTIPAPGGPPEPDGGASGARAPSAIVASVLAALGRPPGLYRVVAVPLWLRYYRVNVLVGPDPATVAIPHSYFVETDDAGRILTAAPPLTRAYP